MKTLLALLLIIPLSLQAELSEWENQTWKCLGQDLLGTGEINGFAHCTNKQTNENYYWDFNDDGFIKDDIIFQIPEDKSFIIFSEYKDETNNGMQFGILKNSDIWFGKYLDGEKHGLEIAHQKSEGLTNIREYWEGQFSVDTPLETKEITDIDNDFVRANYYVYLADENGEFIPNTFYYESETKLDRANNMQPLETKTNYVKINNLNEIKPFGHGVYKKNGNTYYLNWDDINESGQPTQITEEELEEDVILFSMQLIGLNAMKQEFKEENMIFQNNLKEKFGVNFENTFDEILNRLDEYISQNLVASASNEVKLECSLEYGTNNDQEIIFYYTLKNDTLYDDSGSIFYLKEKNDNFYVFAHKDDDLYTHRLNRNNLDMLMTYNSGKSMDNLSCSSSSTLL